MLGARCSVTAGKLLLGHHLASQMTSNHFTEFASLLRCLKGRFPRSIMFHHDGRGFGIDLVKRRPVWIEGSQSNIPITR